MLASFIEDVFIATCIASKVKMFSNTHNATGCHTMFDMQAMISLKIDDLMKKS